VTGIESPHCEAGRDQPDEENLTKLTGFFDTTPDRLAPQLVAASRWLPCVVAAR